jgi:hypothetical protein
MEQNYPQNSLIKDSLVAIPDGIPHWLMISRDLLHAALSTATPLSRIRFVILQGKTQSGNCAA